ncbi:MAG TPA: cyclic peptide export ABC transporter [Thermoanaerobaculia bacterium]
MKIVAFLLRSSKGIVLIAVLAGGLSGLSSTALLGVINAQLTASAPSRLLLWAFIGLCVVVPLARITSELLLIRLGQDTILRLRMDLSRRILAVPLRRLEGLGPHRLLSTLTEDVATVSNVVSAVPIMCVNAAIAVGALVYLAWLSWEVFSIVAILVAIAVVGYQLPIVRAFGFLQRARELHDGLYDALRALIGGTKELKLHSGRREAFLTGELEATARAFKSQNVSGMKIYTLAASWGQLLVFVVVGVLLFGFGTRMGFDHATLTGYTITLLYIMTPLQLLLNSAPTFARANVTLARIEEMGLDLAADASDTGGQVAPGQGLSWKRVELVGVAHAYRREGEESEFCLGPIDLALTPGELVFVAGGNGSGKTTLAKILLGLYVPERGEIRCDGQAVTDENRDAYRQSFSAVFSDFYLFRNLIGLDGRSGDESARRYLRELRLADKVRIEDGKVSSTELSQGQRKRLALLAAYLEDRPIYVFDEWAADQDPVFKEVFYRQLLPALKGRGKTVVVISHDESFYDVADRMIKLEDGRIVADERRPAVQSGRFGADAGSALASGRPPVVEEVTQGARS